MRILVVEDDQKIADLIRAGLEPEGYAVDHALDGGEGLETALEGRHDLIILDLMLPTVDGLDLLQKIRESGIDCFVIVLTARGAIEDRVRGLGMGADEYMAKPFSIVELVARVRARFRRVTDPGLAQSVGPFRLDLKQRTVHRDGAPVELTPREFQLFAYFMEQPDQVLTRAMIAERVWGYQFDTGTNVIDVYVNYLRRKLERSKERFLISVRGVGYVFRPTDCSDVEN